MMLEKSFGFNWNKAKYLTKLDFYFSSYNDLRVPETEINVISLLNTLLDHDFQISF